MNTALLVLGIKVGMVASTSPSGIGKHQYLLVAVHEGLGFKHIGSGRARLEFLSAVSADSQTARPACHLGYLVNAEALDDGVQCGCDGRQSTELFDHSVPRSDCRSAQHRMAVCVDHRFGPWIAVFVDKYLHEPDWKASAQIIDHIFFAVAVYVERGGGRRRFPSVFHDFTPDNCLTRLNAGAVRIVGTAGMVQVVENPRGSRSSLSIEVPMQGCPPWRSAMPNKLPKRPIIVFLAGIFLGLPGVAGAVTLTSLKGMDLEGSYGSYAPRGDCSRGASLEINETGFTFKASGQTVKSTRFEYAASFLGPTYEGVSAVFFPFPVNANDFGRVILTVNDDEKRGVVRLEADVAPGQRLDPFKSALVSQSPLLLCKGSGPASAASKAPLQARPVLGKPTPLAWTNLASSIGKFQSDSDPNGIDLLTSGPIADAIRSRLGRKIDLLASNLSAISGLQRQGSLYWVTGNAPHQGGVEQAYVLLDANRRAVQIGLWEKGKLTVYAPQGGRLPVPQDIARLLMDSPPEDAVPLPGTAWEVVPVQGRAPMAYVDVAASPNIKSFSLFCEGNRPMMAMLLNKPATVPRVTVTWNFAGRLIDIPTGRANAQSTFWQANLTGSQLIPMLLRQNGSVMLRINGRLEGEALLAGAPLALRTAMRTCVKF